MNPEPVETTYSKDPLFDSDPPAIRQFHLAFLCLALVAVILTIYLQVGNHPFLNMDDNDYVTNNFHVTSGLSAKNIVWALTAFDAANWHPLTWLSHMTDVQLFGMNPRGHHLTNVVIHTVSALLLFVLLVRTTGAMWQSLWVAALFALHPLHVESVAWVAERKELLSGLFWFLTLSLYVEYVKRPKPLLYMVTLLSFALGLMSKPMIVTLPIVMLLIDFWPLGRYPHDERPLSAKVSTLIVEKIPFFAGSFLSCLVTIYAQYKGGALANLNVVPFGLRIENALVSYVKYLGNTLWPHDLAPLYLFPHYIPSWQAIGSLIILLLISMAVISGARRHPFLAMGWFWFLITLVPVIGLMKVGSQSMADRYTYIPLTGLFIMAAWGMPEAIRWRHYRREVLAMLAVVTVSASTVLTWQQLGYWRDNVVLYRHTLQATTGSDIIHTNLGLALAAKGDQDAALLEYRKALQINPAYPGAHNGLGAVFQAKQYNDAAISEYQEALRLSPNYPDAYVTHSNLGNVFASKGNLHDAIREYHEALRLRFDNADVHYNLALALVGSGDLDGAIREFQVVLRLNPNDAGAQSQLMETLARRSLSGTVK